MHDALAGQEVRSLGECGLRLGVLTPPYEMRREAS